MSKAKPRLTVATPQPLSSRPKVIWNRCCLCQKEGPKGKDQPVCPARNPNLRVRFKGYETLGTSLQSIRDEGFGRFMVCPAVTVDDFDEGDGFYETMKMHKACYHRSCFSEYTGHPLKSLMDRLREERATSTPASAAPGPSTPGPSANEPASDRRPTRSTAPKQVTKDDAICFLCREPETWNRPLFMCATEHMYDNVRRCAETVKDTRLLAHIATGGDLMAQESKYHALCLSRLYNEARRCSQNENDEQAQGTIACEGLAFADLLIYMQGKLASLGNTCVFRMADLREMYTLRLAQIMGVPSSSLFPEQTTRFREKVLSHFPELIAVKSGREYILQCSGANICNNLDREDQDDDALALNRFVRNMRKCIAAEKVQFNGKFGTNCESDCIPPSLLAFVNMTLYGSAITSDCRATKPALTICQLIIANFCKTQPKGDIVRFSKDREPPFPVYMALSSFGRARDKKTINQMHQHGISVSYNRVMEMTTQSCHLVVERAKEEGVVCPQALQTGLFTIAAVDNIDHKPSSSTSEGEFHGTGISIMQFPVKGDFSNRRRTFWTQYEHVYKPGDRGVPDLPDSYTVVPEFVLSHSQPNHPGCSPSVAEHMMSKDESLMGTTLRSELQWLTHVNEYLVGELPNGDPINVSWAAYYASKETETHEPAIISLLPLLHQKSGSPSTMKHCLQLVAEIVAHLNGKQRPVICVDQPLYNTLKTVQWNCPELFGDLVAMLAPFHTEMWFLRVIGQLLLFSGWIGVMVNSGVTTVGSAEALLKVTHVTKARAAHQLTAAVLHSLLLEAYETMHPEEDIPFETWTSLHVTKEKPTFMFWFMILKLEVLLLSFVRSIRQGNFLLFKECIRGMLPWFFATDHPNYARWLTVDLAALEDLAQTAPEVYEQFLSGNFVVRKTRRAFSGLAIDQAHEQENAVVKAKGGAIGLTQNASSLRRFTIGGPEVSRMLREYEGDSDEEDEPGFHHEQYQNFQDKFASKCFALRESFLISGNPFLNLGSELVTADTHTGTERAGIDALEVIESKGHEMYERFVRERIKERSKSVYATIPQAKLKIFVGKKRESQLTAVKELKCEVQLFSRLFIVSVSRNLDLSTFFSYENQSVPPALSMNGKIRSGNKSHLTLILEHLCSNPGRPGKCDGVIIDGAAHAHNKKPREGLRKFQEYIDFQFMPSVLEIAKSVDARRVDVVWDLYSAESLKETTRDARGAGTRRQGLPLRDTLPSNWDDYLKNSDNKDELFRFLAEKLLTAIGHLQTVTNVGDLIGANTPRCTSLNGLSCGEAREEADGRIILHISDMVKFGYHSVMVRSRDADVVVLCISFFFKFKEMGLAELWILFGTPSRNKDINNMRYIPVHKIALILGERKAVGLRFFHALTGCDLVSYFGGKGKKTAWNAWNQSFDGLFYELAQPSSQPPSPELLQQVEMFIVSMYGAKQEFSGVNDARRHMFATLNKPLALIPPTSAALKQHTLRAIYQAAHLWGTAADLSPNIPCPSSWGWTKTVKGWSPHWSDQDDTWSSCRELDRCGCKTNCSTKRCLCRRNLLPCTPNCKVCGGNCDNKSGGIHETSGGSNQSQRQAGALEELSEDVDGDLISV